MSEYLKSAKGVFINEERAMQELEAHGLTSTEDILLFVQEVTLHKFANGKFYKAEEVLQWLGY
jgi:hypothetical protein